VSDDTIKKPGLREPVPTPASDTRIPSMIAEQDDTGQIQIRKLKPGEIPVVHKANTPIQIPVHVHRDPPPPLPPSTNGNGKVGMKALLSIIGAVAAGAVAFSAYAFTTFAPQSTVDKAVSGQQETIDGYGERIGVLETGQATTNQKVDDLAKAVTDAEVAREKHDADLDDKVTKILIRLGGNR